MNNPSDKPPPPNDQEQLAVIRGILERQETKVDNMSSKVDLVDTRMRVLEATTEGTRIEVQRLSSRVTLVEDDIRSLREKDASIARLATEGDLEHAAAIGGAIAHVSKLEADLATVKTDVRATKDEVRAIAKETSGQTQALATLTEWKSHPAVRFGLFLGAMVGSAIWTYFASRGH